MQGTVIQDALAQDPQPLHLIRLPVTADWIDYNGHMTESRYLFASSATTDALLARIGAGPDYVAGGHSYFTAETHLIHLGECRLGDVIAGSVQILSADARRLHLFVTLSRDGGGAVATVEQLLLHVDLAARRAAPADPAVLARLLPLAQAHADLPRPPAAGRRVGQPRS